MKYLIFLVLLLALAYSQCPPYGTVASKTCYDTAASAIGGCLATNPENVWDCTKCYGDVEEPTTTYDKGQNSCEIKAAYTHLTYYEHAKFDPNDAGIKNCFNYSMLDHRYVLGPDKIAIPWTSLSCVIPTTRLQVCTECKHGYYWKSATLGCSTCLTNCKTCVEDAKCLVAKSSYFVNADFTVTQCHVKAILCASATKAATCVPGYFVLDGVCTACSANSLCTSADKITGCDLGYFLNQAVTPNVCATCQTLNVWTCTAAPTANFDTGITECKIADTSVYYFVAGKGCIAKTWTGNECKTLEYDGTTSKCASCFSPPSDGYGNRNQKGVCVKCHRTEFTAETDGTGAYTSIKTCSVGSSSADVVLVCGDGYWPDISASPDKCTACAPGCKTCTAAAATSCTAPASGYALKTTFQPVECSAKLGCTACTLNASGAWAGTCTALTAGYYLDGKTPPDVLLCSATGKKQDGSTDNTPIANCSACTYADTTKASVTCTACNATFGLQTDATSSNALTCVDITTTSAYKNCATFTKSAGPAYTCATCITGSFKVVSTTNTCADIISGCATMADEAKCSTCIDTTHVLKTANGTCVACSGITNFDKCVTKKIALHTDGATCACTQCNKGYYLLSAGTCDNTALPNCALQDYNMQTEKNCLVCSFSYKWNATTKACEACSSTNVCAMTGCADLAWPEKTVPAAAAAGANSSILVFLLSLLIAIFTFLI